MYTSWINGIGEHKHKSLATAKRYVKRRTAEVKRSHGGGDLEYEIRDSSGKVVDTNSGFWGRGPKSNPAIKLPSKFTPAEVRVNEQGKVQIRINPAKLGSGGRFAKCVESVEAKGGARDPRAVCAAAERKNPRSQKTAYAIKTGQAQWGYFTTRVEAERAATRQRQADRQAGNSSFYTKVVKIPVSSNPSKRSVLKRVRKALTKYVRKTSNPSPFPKKRDRFDPSFHRDGTVTIWNGNQWVRGTPKWLYNNYYLTGFSIEEREYILKHKSTEKPLSVAEQMRRYHRGR